MILREVHIRSLRLIAAAGDTGRLTFELFSTRQLVGAGFIRIEGPAGARRAYITAAGKKALEGR